VDGTFAVVAATARESFCDDNGARDIGRNTGANAGARARSRRSVNGG
jgi:hypothetical protein